MTGSLLEIDWKMLLLGEEQWAFLLETLFRSIVMFLVILLGLRLVGKRGVTQLSVFELGLIIGLGSAAGDPMFYKDVGLLPGIIVFIIVIGLYKLVTYLINRSDKFEKFVEGKPTYVIRKGNIMMSNFEKEPIARDELFMQLRSRNISHLGQVDEVILETNGELSVFFVTDDHVIPGLPIMPDVYEQKIQVIDKAGTYSCSNCGYTKELTPANKVICDCCKKEKWLPSDNRKRIH